MIRLIESSLPSFKPLTLHSGLNILLADAHPESSERQTRNSAGKTSFVELIHFIFGADCDPGSIFRLPQLIEHSFRATMDVGAEEFVVERSGSSPARIFLLKGGRDGEKIKLLTDKSSGRSYLPNERWKDFLGSQQFALPIDSVGTDFGEPYSPAYRSMFSYFARRRNSGGFISEERHAEKQQRWDWQVSLSYLFGLDWRIAQEFQRIRLREKMLVELKRATKGGEFGQMFGTVAELRPQLTVAESRAARLKGQLSNFDVLESYKDLSKRAAKAKTELQAVSRALISLQENYNHLSLALNSETPPDQVDLERMYLEAGLQLPGIVLRRFDEVQAFHQSVISNRRVHLQNEIADIADEIVAAEIRMGRLNEERGAILRSLDGRGALEDFVSMQRDLADLEANAAALRERFAAAELLEGESTKLDADRVALKRRLQLDHQARKGALDEAIVAVSDVIAALYDDRSGRFVVDATDNGPTFEISIEGDRGGGISNIEIFCFDIVLLSLVSQRIGGPGFLIHDSHLFDGVDERQIATALSIGASVASVKGQQYIVTMNSDVFAKLQFVDPKPITNAVLGTRLSDKGETGGLFGFRFD